MTASPDEPDITASHADTLTDLHNKPDCTFTQAADKCPPDTVSICPLFRLRAWG